MECECIDGFRELEIKRKERRKHRDNGAKMIRRAIDLCAVCCDSVDMGDYGKELLANARTGDISAIRDMLEAVDRAQPAEWSFSDAEAVEIALIAVEYLEYGLLSNGATALMTV